MMACPFGIPRYEWASRVPAVRKCFFCYKRIVNGKTPGCTEACPEQATIFGKREALLSIAKERIHENPDKYINKIYGEFELGGSSVLYVSDIPLDFLGFNKVMGKDSLPVMTWYVLKGTPVIAGGIGLTLGAFHWIINRRMKMQKGQKEE
jgi:formate dehydrogenase iron-sulfur subunit